MFPIFGDGWGGIQGLPSHGFARRSTWGMHEEEGEVFLSLCSDEISADAKKAFPYPFTLKYSIQLDAEGFSTTLDVHNGGDAPFSFQARC